MKIYITKINSGLDEFINLTIEQNRWHELGLKRVRSTNLYYQVEDKPLFMLAIIKYGLEFRELYEG